jgi:hypothetical protein
MEYKIKDMTYGVDCRGDYAFFIEDRHIINGGNLDEVVKNVLKDNKNPIFFRVIVHGKETSSHGWIEGNEIVQWG